MNGVMDDQREVGILRKGEVIKGYCREKKKNEMEYEWRLLIHRS